MNVQEGLVLAVLAVMVALLVRDLLSPAISMLGATVLLLAFGVIDGRQAFSGFSNPAPITVAALYVLARAVEKTAALQPLLTRTLGKSASTRTSLIRLLFPTAAFSSFLNNTPIVAMLTPQVSEWADRHGVSASRLLMPLSFAAILGGVVTVIGTSTNLVVSGLLQSHGLDPIGMFEISRIGLPVALLGLVIVILLAPVLLPERRAARRAIDSQVREFVVQMHVETDGPLDGRTVETGGLRNLQGVFLVEIERARDSIAPVAPDTVLRGGDVLTFAGRADDIVDLQSMPGLASSQEEHAAGFDTARHTFFEVVLGSASPLIGSTLKLSRFRGKYQAAVIAIHRAGGPVHAKLGGIRLRVGDTLLLLSDEGFSERWHDRRDFLLVSRLGGTPQKVSRKTWLVFLVAVSIVLPAALGLASILTTALLGALALIALGVLTPEEAMNSVDLDVIVVIGSAFGLGAAIESSGLATHIAGGLVGLFGVFGAVGALLGVVIATVLLTELITNNAAAALLFPIAVATASRLGMDPRPFAIAIAVAASASFLTPIGYQTNTMVYGPGGYRFGDYARLGLPLTVGVIAAILVLVPLYWPF